MTSTEKNIVELKWAFYSVEKIPDDWVSYKADSKDLEGEDVERFFSVDKNVVRSNRTALDFDTVRGIRYAKDAIVSPDPSQRRLEKIPCTKELIKENRTTRAK